jgi:hypothetical protein
MNKWMMGAGVLLLAGCNVESTDEPTGGVAVVGDELCPAGVVAVLSDFMSTQIALLDKDGTLLSESFTSSGSTAASGLAAPLSGDVVAPSTRTQGGEVVLLDRYGTNVVTWVDAASAEVRAQLPVGSGFESNPRDYLELSATKAYIPRWGENAEAGEDPYERGGDVLIVDPTMPEITGLIELPREDDLPPRPSSITLLGTQALVVLQRLAADFASQGSSQLVAIDTETDEIAWQITLDGLEGCGRVMLSPSGKTMALGCTGTIDFDGNLIDAGATGIVLLDATTEPPAEIRRISVHDEFDFPPQPEIEFASETLLLGKTQTPFFGEGNNELFALDLNDDSFRVLAEASPNDDGTGRGIVFGSLLCTPSCSDVCLVADQEHSTIRRFSIAGDLEEHESVSVGSDSGLPPVNLGTF